ncbi:MAG TPA: N-acetylmuramoyl-L-alanine amidase [Terracidiphilus sp.]|nr:N-acetylmuramoyl-L-alanine amidase [Terracidiphilus sp.]
MLEGAVALLLTAFALAVPCQAQAPAAPAPRFVVVLDAAHGGDDLGGRLASGQMEKAVTLALSVKLRSVLNARGIAVVTTREADAAMEDDRRAGIANHAKAAACLSLHATETGAGLHLFTSSLAPAAATRFSAWKTAQAGSITRSLALAGTVNSALLSAGMKVTLGRTTLAGVDSMTCPAVAIELAPERGVDGKVTAEPTDPDYQARVAATLASALLAWRADGAQTGARRP